MVELVNRAPESRDVEEVLTGWRVALERASRAVAAVVARPLTDAPAIEAAGSELAALGEQLREARGELGRLHAAVATERGAREEAEEALSTSLRETDLLVKEIHHRVKNNLQLVASLLSLQADEEHDPRVRAVLRDSYSRVHAIGLIHDKLCSSAATGGVPFTEYARDLATSLVRSLRDPKRAVSLELDLDDLRLPADKAVPLALILSELLSNSLRHAFTNGRAGGTIAIRLHRVDNRRHVLEVADDGVGLAPGLDIAHASTLGFQLVTLLARQLGANLTIGHERGTRLTLDFAPA